MEEAPLVDDQQYLPVTLNVYDSSIRFLGLGLYHTSVQADEQEFMFLPAGEDEISGIVTPNVQGLVLRRTILIGYTTLDRLESAIFVLLGLYHGSSYDLVTKNCNHFSDRLCRLLTGNGIPSWVNRISLLGYFCRCMVPENELNAELAGMVPLHPNPNGNEEEEEEDIEGEEPEEEEEEEEGKSEGDEQEHVLQGGGGEKEDEEEDDNE